VIFFLFRLKTIDYTSPNFKCKTNFDCREWAEVNSKQPSIMCAGNYVCEEQGKCIFKCGAGY
ncbi:hypothetical protein C4579_01210, partial [Candidatus Microgenomates bacterium]